MRKDFLRKVIRDQHVTTKKYVYWTWGDDAKEQLHVRRIGINAADTTVSLSPASETNPDGWETLLILCATSSVFIAIAPLTHCINLSNNFCTYVRM